MVRKLLILLLLGGVLACAAALLFLVQSPEGKALLSEVVQTQLEEETGLRVSLDAVDLDPWQSFLELQGLRVAGPGAGEMFSVSQVHVELSPLQLLGGTVVVHRVDVGQPRVRLIVRDGRIVGLPALPSGGGDGPPPDHNFFRLLIQQLRMTGMDVSVRVEGKHPVSVRLRGLRATVDQKEHDTHAMAFALGHGVITLPNGQPMHLAVLDGAAELHGDGLLRPEQLDILSARMALDDIRGGLRGTVRFAPLTTGLIPAADLLVNGTVDIAQFPRWFPNLFSMGGTVSFDAHVRSAFGARNPTATGSGELLGMDLYGFKLSNATGMFHATLDGIDFTDIRSDYGQGDIRAHGRVNFGKEVTASFGGYGTGVRLGHVMENLRVPGSWVDFNIDAEASFEGTLYPEFRFHGRGETDLTDFHLWNRSFAEARPEHLVMTVPPVHGASEMEFDWKHFSFLDGRLTDGNSVITGTVFLPFNLTDDMWIDGHADPAIRPGEVFDCASITPLFGIDLTCRGPGIFHLRGPYVDPRLWGTAQFSNVSIQGYQLGEAAGRFEYHALLLKFLDVQGKKNRTVWEGDTTLDFRAYRGVGPDGKPLGRPMLPRDRVHVAVAARSVRGYAEDIRAVIPPGWGSVMEYLRTLPLTGPVSGWADARGAVGDATVTDLTFETEFDVGAINLYGQQFDGQHVAAHMDRKAFYFDDLTLVRGPSRWHAVGPIARADGALRVDATISDMPLAQLDVLAGTPEPVSGRADTVINARGTVTDWQGPVRLDLHEVAYGDVVIGNGGLDMMMGGGRIRGSGPLFDGRSRLTLAVKLEPPWAFTADLDVDRGPAQDLVGPHALPKGVTLTLAGKVHAEGALSEARKARGHLALTKVALGYGALALHDEGDIRLRFGQGRLAVDHLVFNTDDGSRLDLKGHAAGDELDLQLEVQADLGVAKAFMPSLAEAKGPVNVTLGITGTPAEPVLVGQGIIQGARFRTEGFRHAFNDIEGNISFIRDRVVVDPLTFKLDDSPVKGHAEVQLKGMALDRVAVQVRFQDLRFQVPEYLPTRLSGTLLMSGVPSDMLLTGDVDVLEARYTENWEWERLPLEFRRRRLAPKVFEKEREWLTMDIHLRADDKILVRNNTMSAEFRGDLHLTGTNERVGMVGTLTSLGGRATYRNNRFELGRSTVDFVDRHRIAVVVDVEAQTRIKGYDVWVDVEGPVEQLSTEHGIRMRSNPDLPAVDVLSLVLFGFTQNDLYRTQGVGSGSSGAVAVGGLDFLTSATGVDKEVRRALPGQVVDEIYLTSRTPRSLAGAAQGSVPAVVVGTELMPGTRLRFTSTLMEAGGNQTEQSVELEKRWSEHLSGRLVWDRGSSIRAEGDAGGDVRYRWEF